MCARPTSQSAARNSPVYLDRAQSFNEMMNAIKLEMLRISQFILVSEYDSTTTHNYP